MIGARRQRARLGQLALALPTVGALALLWEVRPGPPPLPRSLAAPITVEAIEGVAVWLLWLVAALLGAAFLVKALSARLRLRSAHGARWVRISTRSASSISARRPRGSPPRLVIPEPRPPTLERAESEDGRVVAAPEAREHERRVAGAGTAHEQPRISVLGPLTIAGAKRSRRGLRASALELVAYLALHRQPVQRDELLEALWPGEDPKRTRLRLHQAVRDARRLLGSAVAGDRNRYWLERTEIEVDVDELEPLLAAATTAEPEGARRTLERALALFSGEPLSGSDYAWAEGELRRLRATYVDVLERVGRGRLDAGEARAALDAAERGLGIDGLNEGLWRLALEAESVLGLREAVSERYERLRGLLDERLGLEPERNTRALYLELLGQS